ncbi:hypothetical protein BU25DRAFT_393738, partial [Macroventuria anomochaeta]
MVFKHRSSAEKFEIQLLAEAGPNVYFTDLVGSKDDANPITGSWFRLEKGPVAIPPQYEYDEVGIIIEGTMTLEDETGQQKTMRAGDTFVVHRGSTIKFTTDDYGIAWKCSARMPSKL